MEPVSTILTAGLVALTKAALDKPEPATVVEKKTVIVVTCPPTKYGQRFPTPRGRTLADIARRERQRRLRLYLRENPEEKNALARLKA
jgi:GrpB-like predicted nucleotidyltransferase (UPF0157 family)